MRRQALPLIVSAILLSTCVADGERPLPTPAPGAAAPPSLLARAAGDNAGPLAFPPEDGKRLPRSPLGEGPGEGPARAVEEPQVTSPRIEDDKPVEIGGREFQIGFSEPMERPRSPLGGAAATPAAPGTITTRPEIKGRAFWTSAYQLRFVADGALPVGEKIDVKLGALKSVAGGQLASTWHMTLMPRVEIAGKILSYAPAAGQARVVAMFPHDGATVGTRPEIAVLFDQPMDLASAQRILHVAKKDGPDLPITLSHPTGPTFQGVSVDRRFVVLVAPVAPLERGSRYELRVDPAYPKGKAERRPFEAAPPLAITGVECTSPGWDDCSVDKTTIETKGREIAIGTTGHLTMHAKELTKLVRVTPTVEDLYAWSDGEKIYVRGGFERSKTYDVGIVGLVDRYGSRLAKPFHATVVEPPLDASVTMASGVLLLDDAGLKRFQISTCNVAEAELSLWPVTGDGLAAAVSAVRASWRPAGTPGLTIQVPVHGAENAVVTTAVDLSRTLAPGQRYLVAATIAETAYGADRADERGPKPLALLFPTGPENLAMHVERSAARTVVHVARLDTGEAVPSASLALLERPDEAAVTTGADGVALLGGDAVGWLEVTAGAARGLVDLTRPDATTRSLFPALGHGDDAAADAPRAVVFTDRGIYRPGSKVNLFANLRRTEGQKLAAIAGKDFVVRALGPLGEEVFRAPLTTDEMGSLATSFDLGKGARLGRHRLLVQPAGDENTQIAEAIVQVADFEPPRFKVDVDAGESDARTLRASVIARYLFGAPMDGAEVTWTARREAAAIPEGPFSGRGFVFRPVRDSWDDRPAGVRWARAGRMIAGPDGIGHIEQPLSLEGAVGPQRFVIEAEVSDASHRAIAGRTTTLVHPAESYAGLHVGRRWTSTKQPLSVDLALVDREGKAVEGKTVIARLRRVVYSSVARREAGGALTWEWLRAASPAGQCSATSTTRSTSATSATSATSTTSTASAAKAATCDLTLPAEGDYEITAEVDGRAGGAISVWAWNDAGGSNGPVIPSRGRAVELVPDKAAYAPGDTAKLFVTSPFAAATAIVTTDAAGAAPRAQRIVGSAGVIEIPVTAADAPHVHAMVTLLPLAPKGGAAPEYRLGAVRLPVTVDGARLALTATPSKAVYAPGDEADIALEVRDGAAPSVGAQIAIAVVDEGVLRLTGFHAPDPTLDLRPGRALEADVFDTRAALADLVLRSHVAGDGDGDEGGAPSTRGRRGDTERSLTSARKTFAETAFWKPDVRTGEDGRARVRFRLPDNLTQFRVMAVALDREGKGGVIEASFHVSKRVLLVPALPRFVSLGDRFEAASLVHRPAEPGKEAPAGPPEKVTIAFAGHEQRVTLAPGTHARVGFPVRVACDEKPSSGDIVLCPVAKPGERVALPIAFEARGQDGARLDAVEQRIPASFAGLEETPRLDGSFVGTQVIPLHVPANIATKEGDDRLVISLGAQMWPELGERMRYLLGYPHGCVEQTTSSTLPLLAARDIAPRIGLDAVSDAELRTKIRAGLDRLATMRTPGGGLAYWPGEREPNVYGTAYAMRALVLAKAAEIEPPADLLDGMARYLGERMLGDDVPPEVRAAIAQSLSDLGKLDPSAADALYDSREKQSVFGAASLALALSALEGQEDRVASLVDRVEAGVNDSGELTQRPNSSDFHYYGSPARTKAQAAIALRRLRPASPKLPLLVRDLARATEGYTTQATAYSLLALAEELRRLEPGAGDAKVFVNGREVTGPKELPGGGRRFEIPLADLAGKEATLELRSASDRAIGFVVRAAWRRPAGEVAKTPFHTGRGPEVYRVYTDAKGAPVDLAAVKAGDVLRVALVVRRPEEVSPERYGYLAITDRLPAGFEPVQQDLATVSAQPDVGSAHPFAPWFRRVGARPSFVEMHDDRVSLYFDTPRGDDVIATYLVRATTPGAFAIPPATAELMYEPDSLGVTEPTKVAIR